MWWGFTLTKITWITHACFKIKTNSGKVIYTDPYKMENDEVADIILASHDHYDHAEKKSIKKVYSSNTKVIWLTSIFLTHPLDLDWQSANALALNGFW